MTIRKTLLTLASLLAISGAMPLRAESAPTVLVHVAPLTRKNMVEVLTAYSNVTGATGEEQTIALPRGGRLLQMAVVPGQVVKRGEPLFQFATGPTDALAFEQARSAEKLAHSELARTEKLFSMKLATRSQVDSARKALADAEAALQVQRRIGAGNTSQEVTAPFDGVVTSVTGAQGEFLATGAPVLRLLRGKQQQVALGIEPEDVGRISVGMPVKISSVFDVNQFVDAAVSSVHGTIDLVTRRVDIVVVLQGPAARFLTGTQVRGDISVASADVPAVPRSAVLHDDKGDYLFQVKGGHALRVDVHTGIEAGGLVAVSGPLDPALPIVTLGNYELEDGMAVRETAR